MSGGRRALWHGTLGGYTNHGCRCEDCKDAHRQDVARRSKAWRAEENPPNPLTSLPAETLREITERDVLELAYELRNEPNPPISKVNLLGSLFRWLEASRKQEPSAEFTDPTLRIADTG